MASSGGRCVLCGDEAVDAHHILDRKLFPDGGYVVDNGAAVCEVCHRLCENTEISCEEIRSRSGISRTILPLALDPAGRYDKWGNRLLSGGLRVAGPLIADDGCRRALARVISGGLVVEPDDLDIPTWVGRTATSVHDWSDWRRTLAALTHLSAPGRGLDGWLFHGTSEDRADAIVTSGMRPTEVLTRDRSIGQVWRRGSFWGRPITAAYYAEDRAEASGGFRPVLVAVQVEMLESVGAMTIDEATLDFPEATVVGRSAAELQDRWSEIEAHAGWREFLLLAGSVAVLHDGIVDGSGMLIIGGESDAEALASMGSTDEPQVTMP